MKRDILNHLGEKVGELELPEGTPEQVWAEKLAAYAKPPANPVPRSVTNQQMRQALILKSFNEGKVELHPSAITTFINGLPEPTKSLAVNYWEYSNEMFRNNQMLNQLAPMLGLSSEDLDEIFIRAATL